MAWDRIPDSATRYHVFLVLISVGTADFPCSSAFLNSSMIQNVADESHFVDVLPLKSYIFYIYIISPFPCVASRFIMKNLVS